MLSEIDIDSLTLFIQSSLTSPELIDEDLFRDEAVAYNDLCFELNTHLAETDRLIDAGRRDEAIEYAERNGNLLEMFERLDLPERELWCELVSAFELPLPPRLNEDAAEQLNEAYATVGNLNPLLKRHRLLALDRAPIKYRLQVLGELARRDPLNPLWQDNVKTFQQARLNEVPAELSKAMSSGQSKWVEELHEELKSTKWLVPIPAKLKTQIQTAQQAGQRRSAIDEIESLGWQLTDAHDNEDQAAAIAIADQIGERIAVGGVQSDDPILQSISPLLAWVNDLREQSAMRQRDEQAIAKFQATLHRAKTPSELEPALESIRSMGSRFPSELRERGNKRLAAMKQAILLKRVVVIGGLLAATVLVMAGIGGYLYFQHRETQLVELDSSFESLIADQRWDEAKTFYDSQVDAVKLRPAFSSGASEVATAIKAERDRQVLFDDIVSQIQDDAANTQSDDLIRQLREIAKSREDQNVVARQQGLISQRRLMQERASAQDVGLKLDEIEQILARVTGSTPPDRSALVVLRRRMNELRPQVVFSGDVVIRRSQDLTTQIEDAIEAGELSGKIAKMRDRVTQAVGDLDDFETQLTRFASEDCPPEERSQWSDLDLRMSRIKSDEIWCSIVSDPIFQTPEKATPGGLADWIERYETASQAIGKTDHFLKTHLESKFEAMKAFQKQSEAKDKLSEFANSSLLQTMYVYVDQDPLPDRDNEPAAVYYSPKSYEAGSPRHQVNYYADYTLATREKNFGAPRYETMKGLESGHSLFGKWLRQNVSKFEGKQFAPMGVRLVDTLVSMPEDRCDPVFKLSLIRSFLKVLSPASQSLTAGYEPILMRLDDNGFNWEANWFSPGGADSEVVLARQQAKELLGEIDWSAARRRVGETWKLIYASPKMFVRRVGWWNKSGQLSIAMCQATRDDEELVLFRHLNGPQDTVLSVVPVVIGRGGGEQITIRTTELQGTTPAVYAIAKNAN